jgi:beta-lactamase superfamily II metal-dependent hydrolase
MSFHLEGPWLSTTGKKKGKKKFASADHARKARELNDSWQVLLKKYEANPIIKKEKTKSLSDTYSLSIPEGRNTTTHIKSLDTGLGFATKKESPKYTGTLIKGIATMHKSNAVPILNQEDAEAIAKMRR